MTMDEAGSDESGLDEQGWTRSPWMRCPVPEFAGNFQAFSFKGSNSISSWVRFYGVDLSESAERQLSM